MKIMRLVIKYDLKEKQENNERLVIYPSFNKGAICTFWSLNNSSNFLLDKWINRIKINIKIVIVIIMIMIIINK